ncbi:hypothetical protein K3495_g3689 [Podosphaera aphanis]|nr:hypothetical protein K3495_g3689 [Podosphaera aphanis]
MNLDEYNPGISAPSSENLGNYQNSAFTVLPDENLFNDIPGEDMESEEELSEKMHQIGFGFEVNENSRKRARIDGEDNNDDNVLETQILSIPSDRVSGAGQSGQIPRFVAPDGNLEGDLKKPRP